MNLIISSNLKIENIPWSVGESVKRKLTIENPKWVENDRMGRWNGGTDQFLRFYHSTSGSLIVPRGIIGQVIALTKKANVPFRLDDQRRVLPPVDFSFRGTLKPFQTEAVNPMLTKDFGTLSAPTGSGKTVMALCIIAERKQPALIVVHTRELLNQWRDRIETFLTIPIDEIGVIGQGKRMIGDRITVALVQSLYKCADEVKDHIGHLIVDECHRVPSRTFTEAVAAFDSKYMLGLSATPWRRDGLSKLIYWHLGDKVHEVERKTLQEAGHILRADVITRKTNFRTSFDPSEEYSQMLSELTEDTLRNNLIASDVAKEAKNGTGVCLVLSDRKAHCGAIQDLLKRFSVTCEVLTGDLRNGDREKIVERLNRGKVKVLVATGQLIGEGFDCRALSTLFLATPIKFNGRVVQYLGRVLRPAPGKDKAKVYDYVDHHIPQLVASAKSRRVLYGMQ